MSELQAVVVPKELYYHEVAYVRGLEAENRALREALRPFAKFADRFGDTAREDSWVLTRNPSGDGNLTMGDVRAARAALKDKP